MMAKHITKAQLRQLYQAQLIDNDEYLRLLKELAGIESRPTTEYNHYDENGDFIGSSVDTDLSDLLDEAGVEVRADDDWNSLTTIQCSSCGEEWCFETDDDVSLLNYKHCPNCGARMDGGEDRAVS